MKKIIPLIVLLFGVSITAPDGYAARLKIATLAPAGTTWMKEMKKGAKVIKQRTSGRVKFKFYPGGVMGNDQSVHRKIRINQLQGGAFSSSGLTAIDPSIQVLSLPMLFNNFDEVDKVRKVIDDRIKQHVEEKGFVILGISEGGFARIMSSKPVHNLQQIRDSKVWIPEGDTLVEETYRMLGISPIPLPLSDVFTGLQTGLIETIASTSTGAIAFQWHSKLKYMVDTPVMYIIGVLAVSKKAFDKIKPQDQQIVREEMDKVFKVLGKINRKDNLGATAALEKQGMHVITPPAAETQKWRELSQQAIRNMVEKGLIDKALLDEVMSLLPPR